MQRSPYTILSYKIKHNYNVRDFLVSYRHLLQKAIDIIWENINWIEKRQRNFYIIKHGKGKIKRYYYIKHLIPIIPKSGEFKRGLRNTLLENWKYASHHVDSAMKTAYSLINSWMKNYIKGRRRKRKPIVKRDFVRVKETLYVYRGEKIRVTVKPRKLYLEFDLSKAWFKRRVEGCELGELILKENELIITFRKPVREGKVAEYIGWDLNKCSIDGFPPRYGWIKIDLRGSTIYTESMKIKGGKPRVLLLRSIQLNP